ETEIGSAMPTLDELAKSMSWDPGLRMQAELQAKSDRTSRQFGMAYGQKFAKQAQELETLERDKKEAFFQGGEKSERYKTDVEKIKSLKSQLTDAGLMKSDNSLENIDENIKTLLFKAEKEGLRVQAVMAP